VKAARYFSAVDSHTEGMPTRVITGGVAQLPGDTMLERKLRFEEERDDLRLLLMQEPRGHGAMSGAILQPPTRPDADWGVLYIEVSGCLPMCGHGTIGVATVLVETGMVEVTEPEQAQALIDKGLAIMEAINAAGPPVHPEDDRIRGCRHVVFHEPGKNGADAKAATSIHPGWLDRSPCGTGTSARIAQLHALGELKTGEEFVNESVIGTRFRARVVGETTVAGRPAIIPEITGRAWITGIGQYLLDPSDPFPAGFRLA